MPSREPIPAREQTNRAYTYSRKSSPGQSELSLAGQHKDELLYMERIDLVEVEHFDDVGSGLDTDDRDGFLEMIEKALNPENRISHLVFYDLSRFTRSKIDPHYYLDLLDQHDITVHTVMDGKRSDTDDIAWDVKFSLNHHQSKQISFLSMRGKRDAIEAGYAPSSKIPYGYKRGWVTVGKSMHPTYVPHEVHADHVRMMFRMRDEGSTTGELEMELYRLGIPSPEGLPIWPKDTIRKLLRNRAYLGEAEYFKTSKSKFPRNRRRFSQITYANAYEPLVDEERFNRVQKSIDDAGRPGTSSPRSHVSPNPLSDLVKCTECSTGPDDKAPNLIVKTGKDGKELTCSRKKNAGVAFCQSQNVPLEPFLNIIVSDLLERAITREVLQEQIEHINANSSQLVAEEKERQAGIKKRIRAIDKQIDSLKQKITGFEKSHPMATGVLMDDLEKLALAKAELEAQSRNLDDGVAETITFATEPEAVIAAALDLRTYLEADDPSTVKKFLKGFIRRVDVADDVATVVFGLPLPGTKETSSGYTTTVSLRDDDDDEILLGDGIPLQAGTDPPASETVRWIFDLRLQGASASEIAAQLNARGHRPPGINPWNARQVRRILGNEVYCGTSLAARQDMENPDSAVRVVNAFPAIVTQQEFDTVQQMERDTDAPAG